MKGSSPAQRPSERLEERLQKFKDGYRQATWKEMMIIDRLRKPVSCQGREISRSEAVVRHLFSRIAVHGRYDSSGLSPVHSFASRMQARLQKHRRKQVALNLKQRHIETYTSKEFSLSTFPRPGITNECNEPSGSSDTTQLK